MAKRKRKLRRKDLVVGAAGAAATAAGLAQAADMKVQIELPDTDGLALHDTVPVTVTVEPVGNLRSITLTIDGVVAGQSTSSPFTYQWDTTQSADGTHVLVAVAQYKTRKSQAQIAVTVNNTEPPPPPPPPVGTLRYKPPGYPDYTGYTTVVLTTGTQQVNLDNTKDYILDLATKSWSSAGSGRSVGLHINGGRNVVVIGGKIAFTGTNSQDDALGILVDVGADGGIVHLEGLDIACANGITVRTRRKVQIQNTRIVVSAYNDQHSSIHPDVVQVWGTSLGPGGHAPCAGIFMHKVTAYTTYTGLVCLLETPPGGDPLTWERYEVDIHPKVNVNGTRDAGNYAYHCSGPVGANGANGGPFCVYKGEVYAELPTFNAGAGVRGIDDIAILKSLDTTPDRYFPYEIHGPSGATLFTSAVAPTGGSGRAEAKQAGNYMTFAREPALSQQRWIIGRPPEGEFVPASVPGINYVSPGYL